jgi:16S rRNA processing protein RimM
VVEAGNSGDNIDDVVIARIVKARGIKGEVACNIETDFPERFEAAEVTVRMPDGARLSLVVENHWFHKDRVILKFKGYDTMTAAHALVGGLLVIPQSDALPLEEDEFYEYALVGLDVVTGDGQVVGRVKSLLHTGASDILVVESPDGHERLIPFVDDICTTVDTAAGRITVSPPEGLLDL